MNNFKKQRMQMKLYKDLTNQAQKYRNDLR